MKLAYLLAVMALLLVIPTAVFAQYGYSCEGYYGYHYSCDQDDGGGNNVLDVKFSSSCDGNVVTVKGAGNDAHVVVKDDVDIIAAGDTEADVFVFDGCDLGNLYIKVTQSGYSRKEFTVTSVVSCSSCGGQIETTPECTLDAGCLSTQRCVSGDCAAVSCECGTVQNHQCVPYACCSNSQCSANSVCENHVCSAPSSPECTTDAECAAGKYCELQATAAGGSCKDVTGDCGKVENHKFVPYGYVCGTEPGCPACGVGNSCVDHKCVIVDLNCPSTGTVGDKKICGAKEDGVACVDCDYVVTDPAGNNASGKTDEDGNFELPLGLDGTYTVAILKDGVVVKVITVQAFPAAQPKPPVTPPAPSDNGLMGLLPVLLLVLLIVLGLLYWKGKGQKKK